MFIVIVDYKVLISELFRGGGRQILTLQEKAMLAVSSDS